MTLAEQHFDPIATELKQGINLLEASAGTGKTYAIAMLALRFVVEQGLAIDKLLIVTFTKAATKELKERVRARLVEAKQFFTGSQQGIVDTNIELWAEQLISQADISVELAIQRINNALLSIDQAGIFTIHGFCQRLLKEHALESGQMFDVELSDEVANVRQQMAEDFWRVQIYPRDAWEVALLCHEYDTPDTLLASLGNLSSHIAVYPEVADLDACLKQLKVSALAAKKQLDEQGVLLAESVAAGHFKKALTGKFELAQAALKLWLDATATADQHFNVSKPEASYFKLFTSDNLAKEIRVAHKDKLAFDAHAFDDLYVNLQQVSLILRRALAEKLQRELDIRLQQLNIMAHDSLISRTAEALSAAGGDLLVQVIYAQYQVALIDEFQDTDQMQWHIFSRLFAAPEQYLYLIGDPKQAIYKFRGADIHTYLMAKEQAQQHYTLGNNWRSNPDLVHAINHFFSINSNPFFFTDLEFNPVTPGLTKESGALTHHGQTLAPLVVWQLAESESSTGYWTAGKAATEIKLAISNEILALLTDGFAIQKEGQAQVVQPSDIAILVRTNAQAKLYQDCLKEAGIPAVLNSTDSVFKSSTAKHLYQLMQALAQPGDIVLFKQALTLPWFAFDGRQLQQILNDEVQLGAWLSRFQDYHLLWQKKGFMPMMLQVLQQENIRVHLTQSQHAERQMTNLHHLLELTQQASLDEHLGIHKTLAWLRGAIATETTADEQQLRLETDADAVKIVTMHRSKGLEYPIVFCPYLWNRSDRLGKEKQLISCHVDGEMIADLGSVDFEAHRAIALEEELAEDLRVLYVALTRAKYRCYIAWANERSAKKPNQSALAYLLSKQDAFAELGFAEQQAILQQLAVDYPENFTYQLMAANNQLLGSYQSTATLTDLMIRAKHRHLYSTWQMSSYTALSYLSQHDAPELPVDKAEELEVIETAIESEALELAKGAHTGNVLHDLLENIDFRALATRADISEQRDSACQRYGLQVENPELINELLYQTVRTPLDYHDKNFTLENINPVNCLKEMPFYLKLTEFSTEQINFILQDTAAYQSLSVKQMQGFLTGFIDLIVEYQGRYYVLDYKSNALTDYQPETLLQAMREHNYGLQYWIYSVVLHQYLQQRLVNYQFAEHFGGVRYLFMRGMQAQQAMSGVFSVLPDEELLIQLADVFGMPD
jgi:exodeoxyribonuclease V beta subunit